MTAGRIKVKAIKFVPSTIEGGPKRSFLLEFPDFSLSLIETEKGLFAEIVRENERQTFTSKIEDVSVRKEVQAVLSRLNEIVQVYQKG